MRRRQPKRPDEFCRLTSTGSPSQGWLPHRAQSLSMVEVRAFACKQSQRDCGYQPKVGAPAPTLGERNVTKTTPTALWPTWCARVGDGWAATPKAFGVGDVWRPMTQGSRGRQPWALGRSPFGAEQMLIRTRAVSRRQTTLAELARAWQHRRNSQPNIMKNRLAAALIYLWLAASAWTQNQLDFSRTE